MTLWNIFEIGISGITDQWIVMHIRLWSKRSEIRFLRLIFNPILSVLFHICGLWIHFVHFGIVNPKCKADYFNLIHLPHENWMVHGAQKKRLTFYRRWCDIYILIVIFVVNGSNIMRFVIPMRTNVSNHPKINIYICIHISPNAECICVGLAFG